MSAVRTTKPKKRQVAPREGEPTSLLVSSVEAIRDYGILLLSTEGKILSCNRGAELIYGTRKRELLGRDFHFCDTPKNSGRRRAGAELKEAKKTGRYEEEGWCLRRDGSRFWASVVLTKLTGKGGQLLGFSMVTHDLTARKRLEKELRASEERTRLMVASVKDYAIFMLDPQGKVNTWNEGAERIKGYRAKEILGKHFAIFYPASDVREGKCELELREASEAGRFEDEGWRVRKDKTRFWANVVITAMRDANGKLLGFVKVTRDLTDRKRTEDTLQAAYLDLEQRVKERTEELERANEVLGRQEAELREALRVRDEFLSIASHELKTPITSFKMQLQLLQRRGEGGLPTPARFEKFLATSLRQVDRLNQLVEDLLDVAQAGSRKLLFRHEEVDLQTLVLEVFERIKVQADAAGCELRLHAEGSVVGQFDRFRLDQLLVNLLTNAIKYAPGKPVIVDLRRAGERMRISVRDQGPGIPPEAMARLFERFERGANAKNVGGLGLGLFITREIVLGHQGTIHVEAAPEGGAIFVVEI